MSRRATPRDDSLPSADFFDRAGIDPELLNSHRIPDPQPAHTPLFRWLAKVLTAVEARLRAPGKKSLRRGIRFGWTAVILIGVFLLLGPIINKPMDFDDVIDSAGVTQQDWFVRDVKIDFVVDRAPDGTFVAQVTERFDGDFRDNTEATVQRAIVTEFDGHDVEFVLHGAEVDGQAADVTTVRHATTTDVRLKRADGAKFTGTQEITLRYELRHLVVQEIDEASGKLVDRFGWSLFAPNWPQATKGIEVSLTLAPELNDALVRQPQAMLGWLLARTSAWLTVDETTAEGVRYSLSNDQALPPNPDLYLFTRFEPGTFELPPRTLLFWVQTYGPLIPLALLGGILLCALAARRIVWADSAGEPWFVPRSEPPTKCSPALAAELRGKPAHAELVQALTTSALDKKGRPSERTPRQLAEWHARLARTGTRAGRLGNVVTVWGWRKRWAVVDAPVAEKLRWVPDGYVRDSLRLAPVALMLLQWGMLRQLSEQVILSIVWWPTAFVLISTVLAVATLLVVRKPRPLTPRGARLMQQLRGIDVYARGTRLLERGTLTDPVLPYATLGESARKAGRAIAELAVNETNDTKLRRGWRTEHFVSAPAILSLAAVLAVLAGVIGFVSTTPTPYDTSRVLATEYGDLPGTYLTQLEGFEVAAELSRGEHGRGVLRVTERSTVNFRSGARVPQFAREWPRERLGQDLGLSVESVRIDGAAVPYQELPQPMSLAVMTQLTEVLQGRHEVEVVYVLAAPAVDIPNDAGAEQQLRWVAQFSRWDDTYYTDADDPFGDTAPVRPIRVQLTVAEELTGALREGGWIAADSEHDYLPFERGNWFVPWVHDFRYPAGGFQDGFNDATIGSIETRADGAAVMTLDFDTLDADTNASLTKSDVGLNQELGVVLNFAPDTFSEVPSDGFERYQRSYYLPHWVAIGSAALVTFAALFALVGGLVFTLSRRAAGNSQALVSYVVLPLAAVAQSVWFCWTYLSSSHDDPSIVPAVILGGVMWLAVLTQAWLVARSGTAKREARLRAENQAKQAARRDRI